MFQSKLSSAVIPPEKKTRSPNNHRHVPADLVSEVLLNLPTKSVLRFSSVSKAWNSIIFEPGFVKRHSAHSCRVRIALAAFYCLSKASTFMIPPAASSNNPIVLDAATELVCPFGDRQYEVMASCRELLLVRARESLYLWNPSMRTYKQVPEPPGSEIDYFLGLGQESVGDIDDYKILKIPYKLDQVSGKMFELYSLRSDSWTSIVQDFPKDTRNYKVPCVVVSGKLHWLDDRPSPLGGVIISFDLSTERFGEVAQPPMDDHHAWVRVEGMSGLKGMLCLSHCRMSAWDIWVMEEYGVARSWTKKLSIPCFKFELCQKPLYLYENGEVLVCVIEMKTLSSRLFVCDETSRREVNIRSCNHGYGGVFVYVDSLVAPSLWSL